MERCPNANHFHRSSPQIRQHTGKTCVHQRSGRGQRFPHGDTPHLQNRADFKNKELTLMLRIKMGESHLNAQRRTRTKTKRILRRRRRMWKSRQKNPSVFSLLKCPESRIKILMKSCQWNIWLPKKKTKQIKTILLLQQWTEQPSCKTLQRISSLLSCCPSAPTEIQTSWRCLYQAV